MKIRLTVISDGRAGNDAQSLGLAEAICRRADAEIDLRPIRLRGFRNRLPQVVLGAGRARAGGWPFAALQDPQGLTDPGDLVIGAGRRANLFARAVKQAHGARAVAILNPGLGLSGYDLVIAPDHDGLRGGNVIATLGSMNRVTAEGIASAADALPPGWRPEGPSVAVMVGGASRSARFDMEVLNGLIADVRGFVTAGFAPLIVPSPRTPDWAVGLLAKTFATGACWDRGGRNPYPGVLGVADALIVTQDSVNMASEAAATGRPVFISGAGQVAGKVLSFHAALRARCGVRDAAEGPGTWTYEPLREADRVAAIVCDRCVSR